MSAITYRLHSYCPYLHIPLYAEVGGGTVLFSYAECLRDAAMRHAAAVVE